MTVSTHVLDTSSGRPAAGVAVQLQRRGGTGWVEISRQTTNADGRAPALVPDGSVLEPGDFRLSFDIGGYFRARGIETFYSIVPIDFVVHDAAAHYHVPLLVSPYGYSTYRGS